MTTKVSTASLAAREGAQLRFARQVVVCLDAEVERLGPDLSERLRFARERALEHAEQARGRTVEARGFALSGAGASLWSAGSNWGRKLVSVAPLVVLASGLVLIQQWQTNAQISVAAEIDAALLADDLPPTAYRDPGFVEFLKVPPR